MAKNVMLVVVDGSPSHNVIPLPDDHPLVRHAIENPMGAYIQSDVDEALETQFWGMQSASMQIGLKLPCTVDHIVYYVAF